MFSRCLWGRLSFVRSSQELVKGLETLFRSKVALVVINENITFDPLNPTLNQFVSAVSRLDRDLLSERVKIGMRKAKGKGKPIGRRRLRNDVLIG